MGLPLVLSAPVPPPLLAFPTEHPKVPGLSPHPKRMWFFGMPFPTEGCLFPQRLPRLGHIHPSSQQGRGGAGELWVSPCPPMELLEEPTPRCPGKRLRDAPASPQRCLGELGANLPLAQGPAQPHGRRFQQQIPSPSVTSSH